MKNIIYALILGAGFSLFAGCSDSTQKDFENQKSCAIQTEKMKKSHDYITRNHFNKKMNRCFFITEQVISNKLTTEAYKNSELFDALEERSYASMTNFYNSPKPSVMILCRLHPLSNGYRECKSEEEYDAFVAQYMEEAVGKQ